MNGINNFLEFFRGNAYFSLILISVTILIGIFIWTAYEKKGEIILYIVSGVLVLTAIMSPILVIYENQNLTVDELGPIGDYIGGTTVAFLNAAGLLLLLATIFIQKRELKNVVEQNEITQMTMKKQQFETTFFNTLELHRNLLNEIYYTSDDDTYIGRDVIDKVLEELDLYVKKIEDGNRYYHILYFELLMRDYHRYAEKLKEMGDFIQSLEREDLRGIFQTVDFFFYQSPNEWEKENDIQSVAENFFTLMKRVGGSTFRRDFTVLNEFKFEYKIVPFGIREQIFKKQIGGELSALSQYCENLSIIIMLIFERNDVREQSDYIKILQAQLSYQETRLFFYYLIYVAKDDLLERAVLLTGFFDGKLKKRHFLWNEELRKLKYKHSE